MLLTGDQLPVIPSQFLPAKEPETTRDYTYDASGDDLSVLVGAAFSTKPSGAGELTALSLSLVGDVVTVWLTGGVAGRNYIHKLLLTDSDGRTQEVLLGQVCDAVLSQQPIPPPAPSPGFGTVITTTLAYSLDFSNPFDSAYIAVI